MRDSERIDVEFTLLTSQAEGDLQKYFAAVHSFGGALAIIRNLEHENKILRERFERVSKQADELESLAVSGMELALEAR